jgi:hypothetical protein
VRSRVLAVVAATALLAVAGCTRASGSELPDPPVVQPPAASAGGACILWDYGFIKQKIGVTFTVAAAGESADTSTCVVQTETGDYPDLTLAVVESTKADGTTFLDTMPPKATKLKGLGKAGYRLITPARGDRGPIVEIGWLSEAAQLQTLKFTFAKGASKADVTAMSGKLLNLAKAMDTTPG